MPYCYRIEDITFSDGTVVPLPSLTVIVGPNNSGKSRALKDILGLTCTDQANPIVVHQARTLLPTLITLESQYKISPQVNRTGTEFNWLAPTLNENSGFNMGALSWPRGFNKYLTIPADFAQLFGPQLTVFLTTEQRLTMIAEGGHPQPYPENLLQALFQAQDGRALELKIRQFVRTAFPNEVALDFSNFGNLEFRVGKDFTQLPLDPRDARPILASCERLTEQGDGLRSYVGIVTALTTMKRPVYLIDEPESFLHPPQAFRMGQFLAGQASAERQLIVATHSADVLRGIIFNSPDAQIIRLDRVDTSNTVRLLDKLDLSKMVKDPLLSASKVLDGLFYSSVVVTEADGDSRFFQAISNKLDATVDLHFVNADNKQTVPKVIAPYKRLGVRCAGIVDIDVLNDATEFKKQLEAAGFTSSELGQALKAQRAINDEVNAMPTMERLRNAMDRLAEMSKSVNEIQSGSPEEQEKVLGQLKAQAERLKSETSGWQKIKKEGVACLVRTRDDFEMLYKLCSSAGLFINPCGELESSLNQIGKIWHSNKREWIAEALQLIPNLTPDPSKQPWMFMADIHAYLRKIDQGTHRR